MNIRNAAYWSATVLTSFVFVSGGISCLAGMPWNIQGFTELGYPVYFVSLLGAWKLLGGLVILVPRFPLLKEWAYAGIAFDLVCASASHLAVGHTAGKVVAPMIILGIVAVSWALRPDERTVRPVLVMA
jgi:hypothetical protein